MSSGDFVDRLAGRGNRSRTPAPPWIRDSRGRIVCANLDNIRLALAHLGITLSYDAFAREVRVNDKALDDLAFEQTWTRITDSCKWQPSRTNLHSVIICDAHSHAMHPVRAYLQRLEWDGTERLEQWLVTYAGAVDTPYVRAVSALPLLAAVRRIREPGAKFDELLVLESPQGTGKSSALRALCGVDDWFSDDLPLGVDSKLVIERTAGKWIIEASELVGTRRGETETLKAFLSRQVDGPVRPAFGRFSVSVPRQFVLIGTTNHRMGYLKDMTGARRFWPVALKGFDVAALARDRDQLWAEAVRREPTSSIRLLSELWHKAAEEQEARRAVDPWEELIEPLLEGDGENGAPRGEPLPEISSALIWHALRLEASFRDYRHSDRVTAILERHGYHKNKNSEGYMVWRRSTAVQNDLGSPEL